MRKFGPLFGKYLTFAGSSSNGGGIGMRVGTAEIEALLPTSRGTYL
jgi:hypothetical protein